LTGRRGTLLLCGAGLLALAAPCGAGSQGAAAGLALRLEVTDAAGVAAGRFAAGAPVALVLEVRNAGEAPRRVEFATARTHDFALLDAGGREVWRWSRGRLFAQALSETELAPGEARRYTATWHQRDAAGEPAPPGRYRALGSLACLPAPLTAEPVELVIE
jgi:hypothetical protein